LTKEYWGQIAKSPSEAHQASTLFPAIDNTPTIKDFVDIINSTPSAFKIPSGSTVQDTLKLIINLMLTMSDHRMGAIYLTSRSIVHRAKADAVALLQQNLPQGINTKIHDYIAISNALANLLCIDFTNTDKQIPDKWLIPVQYMLMGMDGWTQRMRSEIATMIENFLLGE
jgi:hypothetical protein